MQCTATTPITSRLRGPSCGGTEGEGCTLTAGGRAAGRGLGCRHPGRRNQSTPTGRAGAEAASCLTRMPAFFRARGSPSSPVPMFPFRRWIRVWYHLREGRCRGHPGEEVCTQSAQTQPSVLPCDAGGNTHEVQTLSTKPSRNWDGLEVKTSLF